MTMRALSLPPIGVISVMCGAPLGADRGVERFIACRGDPLLRELLVDGLEHARRRTKRRDARELRVDRRHARARLQSRIGDAGVGRAAQRKRRSAR